MLEAKFTSSYSGETDYYILENGRRIAKVTARHWGDSGIPWNTGVWESDILPSIGTVWFSDSSKWGDFVSAEIMALFPGYVARTMGRNDKGLWQSWYAGEPPQLSYDPTIPKRFTFIGHEDFHGNIACEPVKLTRFADRNTAAVTV